MRISKFTYGVTGWVVYDHSNPEHVKRDRKSFVNAQGRKCIPGYFQTMLSKGTKVLENGEIKVRRCARRVGAPATNVLAPIIKYDGDQKEPGWVDAERDKFKTLCRVVADISAAPCKRTLGKTGKFCYSREYEVVLLVGLAELKAQIRWSDSITGEEISTDASIVYDAFSCYEDVP